MSGIRSISEGTFVIGDTNGLTFEAGPGISVSQPSEGTVRIGNDETVLYDTGNTEPSQITSDTNISLSESALNFSIIRVYYKTSFGGVGNFTGIAEGWVSSGGAEFSPNPMITGVSNPTIMCDSNSFLITSSASTTLTVKAGGIRINIKSDGIATTSRRGIRIYKVTGVNRISGGNNE